MKLLLGALLLLALPATAQAVILKPPNPNPISISGTGAPQCTTLTFVTAKVNYRVRIKVADVYWVKWDDLPAGTHNYQWCIRGNLMPGDTVDWWVAVRHYEDNTAIVKREGEPIQIVA